MQTTKEPESEIKAPEVEAESAPKAPTVGALDSIAQQLSSSMPDVQEHAIEQERAQTEEAAAQYAEYVDKEGLPFDPSVHKVNKAGEPTLSTKGLLVRKPGRKAGGGQSAAGSVIGRPQAAESPDPGPAREKAQARATGIVAASMLMQIGIVAGGEEWRPIHDDKSGLDEKAMLEGAFADYFEATGKTDLPPGMCLAIAIGGYALPRFAMPKTQTRVGKLKGFIKQWWIDRRLKKHGLKSSPIKDETGAGELVA